MNRYVKETRCPKCGGIPRDRYHKDGHLCFDRTMMFWDKERMPEHIHRTCQNCSYDWREAPLNGAQPGFEDVPPEDVPSLEKAFNRRVDAFLSQS